MAPPSPPPRRRKLRTLRRSPDNRVLGGVCGAVSQATGIDATWVRIGFVLLAIASGVMVFVYAMAWLLIPMEGETANIYSRAVNDRRGIRTIAAILIPLLIAVQFITSSLHVPFIGFIGLADVPGRRRDHPHLAQRRRVGEGVHRPRRRPAARGGHPRARAAAG